MVSVIRCIIFNIVVFQFVEVLLAKDSLRKKYLNKKQLPTIAIKTCPSGHVS
ncbi:MAG: hypothetical protein ACJAV5_000109 [Vicingaceae bacterium]|jgi:hypothetical protein